MKPERSIGVCADLIIEIEQRMELLVLKDGGKKILQKATSASPSFPFAISLAFFKTSSPSHLLLLFCFGQAMDVVKTIQHQPNLNKLHHLQHPVVHCTTILCNTLKQILFYSN